MIDTDLRADAVSGTIDAHQHFWQYHPDAHQWINDAMAAIRKDFLPADLQPVLKANGVAGCVAVQADQSETETDFLLQQAAENDIIKGVVGWVDLRSDLVEERLAYYTGFSKLKGFRHILQGEPPEFMLQPDFMRGIGLLKKYGFTYDILIYPQHLAAALELVRQFPDQSFVIDHIAKPFIKNGWIEEWQFGMKALSQCPNVYCKLSGMVTEADMRNWKEADFTPYLDIVTELFGVNRIMFGSDWPVCLPAATYTAVINIVRNYFSGFSVAERQCIFEKNAVSFYHLI